MTDNHETDRVQLKHKCVKLTNGLISTCQFWFPHCPANIHYCATNPIIFRWNCTTVSSNQALWLDERHTICADTENNSTGALNVMYPSALQVFSSFIHTNYGAVLKPDRVGQWGVAMDGWVGCHVIQYLLCNAVCVCLRVPTRGDVTASHSVTQSHMETERKQKKKRAEVVVTGSWTTIVGTTAFSWQCQI